MSPTQSETKKVCDACGQYICDQRQEHRPPNHDDGEIQEPLPQTYVIVTY